MKRKFTDGIQIYTTNDNKKLSMRHGPIDLIIEANGCPEQVERAYRQASLAFESVLTDLVSELELLRTPLSSNVPRFRGEIAMQMHHVARKIADELFVTPMIAVAGAVADHILVAMRTGTELDRAYVNNGGDIAVYLNQNEVFDIGICANIETGNLMSKARICADDLIGGVATSGWRGRSHSLGIADAVTVLADNAATADAAATLIANAIDLPGHIEISRMPASELAPDSDLGDQLVTVGVGILTNEETEMALGRGRKIAQSMIDAGVIKAVYASLNDKAFSVFVGKNEYECLRSVESGMLIKEVNYA